MNKIRAVIIFVVVSSLTLALSVLPSFTAFAALAAPATLEPEGQITNASPIFTWTAVDTASTYEIAWGDDTDQNIYFQQDGILGTSFSLPGAVFDLSKVYHWKVRSADPAGNKSAWSEIESFIAYDPAFVPHTIAPIGYITSSTPNFQWSAVPGAVSYDLWVMNEAETETSSFIGSLTDVFYQEPSNMPFPLYSIFHYRVRARHSDGSVGAWSDPNSFMFFRNIDTPQLIGPSIQSPFKSTNFSWQPVEAAVGYEFVLMNEAETISIIHEDNVPLNGYAPKADSAISIGPIYHWKVRSLMAAGGKSVWSKTMSFVFFDDPLVPYPLGPFGIVNNFGGLVVEWSQVSGAQSYELEVRDSLTQELLFSDSATDAKYDLRPSSNRSFNIQADRSYDWRVRSVMAGGIRSVFSIPRALRVASRMKLLQDWSGIVGESTNQFISHEEKSESVLSHVETTSENRPFGNIIRTVDTVELRFKDVLDKVIVTVPQLKVSDSRGALRYHFVLRNSDVNGSRTIWSGDGQYEGIGDVRLELPNDVSVALEPRAVYAWVIQVFTVDGTQIGQAERQVVDGWKYDSKLGDYVAVHAYDKIFNFTSLRDIVNKVGHVSYQIVDDPTLEVARLARDQAARDAAAALVAAKAAAEKAAYAAMSPSEKAAYDTAQKVAKAAADAAAKAAAVVAAAKAADAAAIAKAAYDALSPADKAKVDAKRASDAAYAKMTAAERVQYNLKRQAEANAKRETLARALDAANASLQVKRENNARVRDSARALAAADQRALNQAAEGVYAQAISGQAGIAAQANIAGQAQIATAREVYAKAVAAARALDLKQETDAKAASAKVSSDQIAAARTALTKSMAAALAARDAAIKAANDAIAVANATKSAGSAAALAVYRTSLTSATSAYNAASSASNATCTKANADALIEYNAAVATARAAAL